MDIGDVKEDMEWEKGACWTKSLIGSNRTDIMHKRVHKKEKMIVGNTEMNVGEEHHDRM